MSTDVSRVSLLMLLQSCMLNPREGGGVLPYKSLTGTCGQPGYEGANGGT